MGLGAEAPPSLAARVARSAVAVAAAFVLAACTKPPVESDPRGGEDLSFPTRPSLRIATQDVESIDPVELETLDEIVVADQVFDGLVAYEPETTELVPSAAQSWEVRDGGRTFVFHLRGGATFHDGSPVQAEDFVFAWNRLADPAAAAPFAFLLESVAGYDSYQSDVQVRELEGVRALDATTLEVRLSSPWPDFVSVAGHPALSPLPSREGADLGPAVRVIGNGPFRAGGTIARQEEFHLERFDDHFAAEPAIRRLTFRPFEDADDAWPEFLAGDVDIAPIPASLLAEAEGRYGEAG
ncbi:MAG TPA: ABC transporter substrate-binding protein, partial [Actinomycetota bacterium]|nr:ABC transporter substrate-binding protein [Actinomycetota bacterium]